VIQPADGSGARCRAWMLAGTLRPNAY